VVSGFRIMGAAFCPKVTPITITIRSTPKWGWIFLLYKHKAKMHGTTLRGDTVGSASIDPGHWAPDSRYSSSCLSCPAPSTTSTRPSV